MGTQMGFWSWAVRILLVSDIIIAVGVGSASAASREVIFLSPKMADHDNVLSCLEEDTPHKLRSTTFDFAVISPSGKEGLFIWARYFARVAAKCVVNTTIVYSENSEFRGGVEITNFRKLVDELALQEKWLANAHPFAVPLAFRVQKAECRSVAWNAFQGEEWALITFGPFREACPSGAFFSDHLSMLAVDEQRTLLMATNAPFAVLVGRLNVQNVYCGDDHSGLLSVLISAERVRAERVDLSKVSLQRLCGEG